VGGSVGSDGGVGVATGIVGSGVGSGRRGVGVAGPPVLGGGVAPPDGPGVGTDPGGGVWDVGPPGVPESLPEASRSLLMASMISGERRGIFRAT